MRLRASFVILACAAAILAGVAIVAEAPPSEAGLRVTLERPRPLGDQVVLRGRAVPSARVVITRRSGDGWVRVAVDRADRRGRYQVSTRRPARVGWVVRAVAKGRPSPTRTVPPVAAPTTPLPVEQPPVEQPPVEEPTQEEPPAEPAPADACGTQPRKSDGSYWRCTFVDDFAGTALDPSKWLVQETWFSGMTTAHGDCYVNDPGTVGVADGSLRLTIRRGLEPFVCKSPYGDFTTTSTAATVATYKRFSQTYGRFEFRAKFPDLAGTPGTGSGLWLYPQEHTYGKWPLSGEIDVAEWFSGRPELVHPSVHYAGEDPTKSTGRTCPMTDVGTRFHTYGVEWTPTSMRFFYDGKVCFEHAWTPTGLTAPQPFDHPFYLVITQAWGSAWNTPGAGTPMSATMSVDWVRAWE